MNLVAGDSGRMRLARLLAAVCVVGMCAVVAAAMASTSLRIELRGFGESVGSTAACSEGQTLIPIVGSSRSVLDCVVSVGKLTKPGLDPWRIIETVRATIRLSGGTLRTAETQVFTFTRSGTTTAAFRGRVTGGSGRFAGSSGTVSGGGQGRTGAAIWHVTFQLR